MKPTRKHSDLLPVQHVGWCDYCQRIIEKCDGKLLPHPNRDKGSWPPGMCPGSNQRIQVVTMI